MKCKYYTTCTTTCKSRNSCTCTSTIIPRIFSQTLFHDIALEGGAPSHLTIIDPVWNSLADNWQFSVSKMFWIFFFFWEFTNLAIGSECKKTRKGQVRTFPVPKCILLVWFYGRNLSFQVINVKWLYLPNLCIYCAFQSKNEKIYWLLLHQRKWFRSEWFIIL